MKIEHILIVVIYFIIFIKVIFLISALGHLFFSKFNAKSQQSIELNEKFTYWKSRSEFVFTILMAILLIFIFSPRHNHQKYITKELGILLYLFGFILIITADWNVFFTESKWFTNISNAVKL